MSDPCRAVFLSYASQDAEAARHICESLRAAGIEVWFDQNELRGGDVWDQNIRQQIQSCAMFVPIISANTESRTEGYFRLEWKLAVDRSHLMADDAAFLFPVVIDDTPQQTARVPDKFRSVQWTRLPDGNAPAAFSQRVAALLCGSAKPVHVPSIGQSQAASRPAKWAARAGVIAAVVIAMALSVWWTLHRTPGAATLASSAAPVAPAHSIAVLPFADLSADRGQEYISDGLAEELLNLLSKVPGLQVAARTSAFSFKGRTTADIPTIARQLVVANVLEGSVRKDGNHLRVSAQLVRADNGYEVWSEIYDRDLGDIFRIQDEIAAHVVKSLQLKLLGAEVPRSASTQNIDAYLVFLRGRAKMATQRLTEFRLAVAEFERALKLDPNFSPAYVELAIAKMQLAEFDVTGNRQADFDAASEEAKLLLERALALDPRNAQAYVERGYLRGFNDLKGAEQDFRKGIELDPNSARGYAGLAAMLNEDPQRSDEVPALLDKASLLDPLDPQYAALKAQFLFYSRSDVKGADAILTEVVRRSPTFQPALWRLSEVRRLQGNTAEAIAYGEQALKLDPLSKPTRLFLISSYLELDEIDAARQVADEAPHPVPIERISLIAHDGDWHRAAELGYEAIANGTMTKLNEGLIITAFRLDARATHDFGRARVVLERLCGVTWNAQGAPTLPMQLHGPSATIGLADILIASGDRARGERLLRASLADLDYQARELKRGDFWYVGERILAYALLGDHKGTMNALTRAVARNPLVAAFSVGSDLDLVSNDPEYQAMVREGKQRLAIERQKLARLRAEGRAPFRGKTSKPAP